jgi:putative flippase GtrA
MDISTFLSHDAGPVAQFIKYAVVGGLATAVNILAFFLAGWFLFPCLTENDVLVRLLRRFRPGLKVPEAVNRSRAANAIRCNVIAFFFSNTFCYILNRLFVFQPGHHSVVVEAVLFFLVSAFSTFVGTACQTLLIKKANMQTTFAFGANLIASLAINFVMRKFVVFNG